MVIIFLHQKHERKPYKQRFFLKQERKRTRIALKLALNISITPERRFLSTKKSVTKRSVL
jgi:hypothetical protein